MGIGLRAHRGIGADEAVAGPFEVLGIVDPGLGREVLHPPVGGAAMVRHHIHQHFQPLAVGLVHERAVEFVGAVAGIDAVIVGTGVAVVGIGLLVVEEQRRRPDGRGAQAGNVVEVVDDALDVAAVGAAEILRRRFFGRFLHRVVLLVAVGEAVGHQQVDHVGRAEGRPFGGAFAALGQFVVEVELTAVGRHHVERVGTGSQPRADLHLDEQVVRVVGRGDLADRQSLDGSVDRHVRAGDVVAVEHQLQVGVHTDPPAGRFDPVDAGRPHDRSAEHGQDDDQQLTP